ncbi:MAG TPA: helix-turn-helix transcriptional regulator, partial [Thermoanaerobaculia bacterium]|nr:helix-turn-helix transcriptional regulator [Thermoanaerobaculia bacterium]
VELFESQPDRAYSLAELCDRFHVSPSHLQHLFKRDMHMSIREFMLRSRLRAAARLIGTTRERIRQISFAAGFRDISNFNHAFKRQFGISPREYRVRSILSGELPRHSNNGSSNQ